MLSAAQQNISYACPSSSSVSSEVVLLTDAVCIVQRLPHFRVVCAQSQESRSGISLSERLPVVLPPPTKKFFCDELE